MHTLIFYVPPSHAESVKQACFSAGAGKYRNYECCCWQSIGKGQFKPLKEAKPFIGKPNQIEYIDEIKVEMICEDACVETVIHALKTSHPYEEPAFALFEMKEVSLVKNLSL